MFVAISCWVAASRQSFSRSVIAPSAWLSEFWWISRPPDCVINERQDSRHDVTYKAFRMRLLLTQNELYLLQQGLCFQIIAGKCLEWLAGQTSAAQWSYFRICPLTCVYKEADYMQSASCHNLMITYGGVYTTWVLEQIIQVKNGRGFRLSSGVCAVLHCASWVSIFFFVLCRLKRLIAVLQPVEPAFTEVLKTALSWLMRR